MVDTNTSMMLSYSKPISFIIQFFFYFIHFYLISYFLSLDTVDTSEFEKSELRTHEII